MLSFSWKDRQDADDPSQSKNVNLQILDQFEGGHSGKDNRERTVSKTNTSKPFSVKKVTSN